METGNWIIIGVAVLILACLLFTIGYNLGYSAGVGDILDCETDMECELVVHRAGK